MNSRANAGYEASVVTVDALSRDAVHALVEKAGSIGEVTGLIHAAGVSPSQASPATILKVDLYGSKACFSSELDHDLERLAIIHSRWSTLRRPSAHNMLITQSGSFSLRVRIIC